MNKHVNLLNTLLLVVLISLLAAIVCKVYEKNCLYGPNEKFRGNGSHRGRRGGRGWDEYDRGYGWGRARYNDMRDSSHVFPIVTNNVWDEFPISNAPLQQACANLNECGSVIKELICNKLAEGVRAGDNDIISNTHEMAAYYPRDAEDCLKKVSGLFD